MMSFTAAELENFSNKYPELRQLVTEIVKHLNDSPPGDVGSTFGLEEVLAVGNNAGGLKITNLSDPEADQDASNKKYVDDNSVALVVGISNAMQAGVVTVNTTAVTADSKIFLSHAVPLGTLGWLSPGTIVPGVSFVINSTGATDLSTVNWLIIN